jgi:PAS domain S-box-containing protein
VTTLGGQAAMAAANTSLFQKAEVRRQRLAAILAASPDPVLVTDRHNRLLLANPVAWRVLGLSAPPMPGVPIDQVVSQPEIVELLISSNAEPISREISFSEDRVFFATATSVIAEGQQMGRVCVLRDITHFKRLDADKSEFVATVSHDLRSPLTLVKGYVTMLKVMGELNEQQQDFVRKIIIGVENMERLVNNLLDLGRIEAGMELQLEMVPLLDLIDQVVDAFKPRAVQRKIDLQVEYPPDTAPIVEADYALLRQALHNLVDNALKYTPPGGWVKVGVHVNRGKNLVGVMVKDTGIGIAPVDQSRLFEKFYRVAHREARKERGSGLGLAIVKSITQRHNGRVGVKSQLGKGSTFFLELPLRQPRPEAETSETAV